MKVLGLSIVFVGFILAIYIAVWWGLVEPIMEVAEKIDQDTLTATDVGMGVVKLFLREALAGIVAWVSFYTGMRIAIKG